MVLLSQLATLHLICI